jgi:hypothetical protein
MSLATHASPAWYVSDGLRVVGPVNTDLLLRGVAHGRVDEGYFVWQRPWPAWRTVDSLREVRAARARGRSGGTPSCRAGSRRAA